MLGIHVVVQQKLQRKVPEELHRDYPGIVFGTVILLVESHGLRYLRFSKSLPTISVI